MKVEIVLVIVFIALVKGSEHSNDDSTVTKQIAHNVKHTSSSGTKQWTPHSPKNVHIQRFTTIKSIIPRTSPSHVYKPSSRAVTSKMIPAATKVKNSNFWKLASTRRPYMKHMQFTVTPMSTTKRSEISIEARRKHKSMLFNKMHDALKNDDSSEEISETSNTQNTEKFVRSTISPIRRMRTKVIKLKKVENTSKSKDSVESQIEVTTKNIKSSESEFSSEELEDREEFIFVKPKDIKENDLDITKDDSIESEENTTVKEQETEVRHRRSVNVIEEENLGTTVSGFKFTGKVAPLSSDLIFRNINT